MSTALPPLCVCFCQDAQVLHKNPALHMPQRTDGTKSECQEFAANSEFGFCLGYFVCNCCKCFDWLRLVRMCWFVVASNFLQALSILTVLWAIKSQVMEQAGAPELLGDFVRNALQHGMAGIYCNGGHHRHYDCMGDVLRVVQLISCLKIVCLRESRGRCKQPNLPTFIVKIRCLLSFGGQLQWLLWERSSFGRGDIGSQRWTFISKLGWPRAWTSLQLARRLWMACQRCR